MLHIIFFFMDDVFEGHFSSPSEENELKRGEKN